MNRLSVFLVFILLAGSLLAVPVKAETTGYYALSFDGVNDHVTAQGISSNELSVVVLFKATNITGEHTLLDARKWGTSFGGWNLRVENGALKFITVWNDTGTYKEAGVSANISASRTYLAVAVHDGSESRLYLDGQLTGSVAVDGLTENSESTLWIGENRAGSGFFEGTIYLILIYNRALSDSEIQAIYENPLDPPKDGLVLWYAPDSVDTVNGLWKDKSGNGNDGTIYGASYVPLRPIGQGQFSEAHALHINDNSSQYIIASGFNFSLDEFSMIAILRAHDDVGEVNWQKYVMIDVTNQNGTSWAAFDYYSNGVSKYFYFSSHLQSNAYIRGAGSVVQDKRSWHMLAWVASKSGNYRKSFFDGTLLRSLTGWEGSNGPGPAKLRIHYIKERNFDIVAVYLYSRALSDAEIQAIYNDPLNPPTDGLVLFYNPYSYDPVSGKWLNVAPIFPTIPLAEELDAVNYGATPERVSIPHLSVYDIENNSEIQIQNVSVSLIENNTTTSLIPSLLTLPYNTTVTLNVSAPGFKPRTLTILSSLSTLDVYLQPINQTESLNIEQAVNVTELVKNITSYSNITPINPYAKAFFDSGGSFGDTIKLALQGDSLMRLILPQVLILAIVIVVLVQTASPLAALAGALIGWAMSLGIIGEAPSMRNSGMTFMLVVFLVAWTLWDLFYNYSRET